MSRTGTSVYPTTLDSFDRIGTANYEDESGYEHTSVHNEAMDGIENIQGVLGTTAGTSVLKNVQVGQFVATSDGWTYASDTWTYASATTFTIAGVDRTAMFPIGTKIKLTQTSVKYFYVVGSAFSTNTTITVIGGSDYSLASATITSPYYSYSSTPQGFPHWFNYTPILTNVTIGSATILSAFCMNGKTVTLRLRFTMAADSSISGTVTFSFPVTARWVGTTGIGVCYAENLGIQGYMGFVRQQSSTTAIPINYSNGTYNATAPFTWETGDFFSCYFTYEAA